MSTHVSLAAVSLFLHPSICIQVDSVAAGLLALGLKRGERLGVWGPNTYEWILFQFASAKAGIILVSRGRSFTLQIYIDIHLIREMVPARVH